MNPNPDTGTPGGGPEAAKFNSEEQARTTFGTEATSGDAKPASETEKKTPYEQYANKRDPGLIAQAQAEVVARNKPGSPPDARFAVFYDVNPQTDQLEDAYVALGWKKPADTGPKAQEQPASSEAPKQKQASGETPGGQAQGAGPAETNASGTNPGEDMYRQAAGRREEFRRPAGAAPGAEKKRDDVPPQESGKKNGEVNSDKEYTPPEGAPVEDQDGYYRVLGVEKNARPDEIRSAYRRLAKEAHPDLHPDDPEAHTNFQRIGRAYEVVGNPNKRAVYDIYPYRVREQLDKLGKKAERDEGLKRASDLLTNRDSTPQDIIEAHRLVHEYRLRHEPGFGRAQGAPRQEQKPGGQAAGQPPRQEQRQQQPPPRAEQKPAGAAGAKPGAETKPPLTPREHAMNDANDLLRNHRNLSANAELLEAMRILQNPFSAVEDLDKAYRVVFRYKSDPDGAARAGGDKPKDAPKPGAGGARPGQRPSNPFEAKRTPPKNPFEAKPEGGAKQGGFGDRPGAGGAENRGANKPGGGFGDRPAAGGDRPNPFKRPGSQPGGFGERPKPGGENRGAGTPGTPPGGERPQPGPDRPRAEAERNADAVKRAMEQLTDPAGHVRDIREALGELARLGVILEGRDAQGKPYRIGAGDVLKKLAYVEDHWEGTVGQNAGLLQGLPFTSEMRGRIGMEFGQCEQARDILNDPSTSLEDTMHALEVLSRVSDVIEGFEGRHKYEEPIAPMIANLRMVLNGNIASPDMLIALDELTDIADMDLKAWYHCIARSPRLYTMLINNPATPESLRRRYSRFQNERIERIKKKMR